MEWTGHGCLGLQPEVCDVRADVVESEPIPASAPQAGSWRESSWVWCIGCFLVSRVVYQVVGIFAQAQWREVMEGYLFRFASGEGLAQLWRGWEGGWYAGSIRMDDVFGGWVRIQDIQERGGFVDPGQWYHSLHTDIVLLVEAFTGDMLLAGVLVSAISLLVALRLLYAFGRRRWGEPAAKAAVAAFCCMPYSHLLSAVSQEALFVCLLLASLVAADRGLLLLALCCTAFLIMVKLVGVMMLVPIAWCIWEQHREPLPAGMLGASRRKTAMLLGAWCGAVVVSVAVYSLGKGLLPGMWGALDSHHFPANLWRFPWQAFGQSLVEPGGVENLAFAGITACGLLGAACLALLRRWMELSILLPVLLYGMCAGPEAFPLGRVPAAFAVAFPIAGVVGTVWGLAPQLARLGVACMVIWSGFLMTAWATGLRIGW